MAGRGQGAVLISLATLLLAAMPPVTRAGLGRRVVCYIPDWAVVSDALSLSTRLYRVPTAILPGWPAACVDMQLPAMPSAAVPPNPLWLQWRPDGSEWWQPDGCKWRPSQLNPDHCTHVMYSFAFLDESFNPLIEDVRAEAVLVPEAAALKQRKPSLKVMLSIGGW